MKRMVCDIVLVHIGSEFPTYINHCIAQLRSTCADALRIHILIDAARHGERVIGADCVVDLVKLDNDSMIQQFEAVSRHDPYFRGGFWKHASKRFFYLRAYMLAAGLEEIFHIENDNLVFYDFTKKLDIVDLSLFFWVTLFSFIAC